MKLSNLQVMFFRVSSLFSVTVLENQGYSSTHLPSCIEAASVFAGCARMESRWL